MYLNIHIKIKGRLTSPLITQKGGYNLAYINITADELNAAKQRIQNKYAKIELLNLTSSGFQVVDSLEGVTLNGSISVDANSDMRRSATLKFIITDSSFEVQAGSRIWLDKYLRIFLGTYSMATGEIVYTKIGTFVLDAPSYEYDAVNNAVQVTGLDLMCKLSGLRDGYLPGVPTMISAGENIRQAMIDTLALGGFTQYVIDEAPSPGVVPTDLQFNQGATVYTLLSGLRDIYPNYEIYFDVDGVFHYNPIPTGEDEPIQIDDTLWDSIVIGEKVDVDFQNVKNYIEVYGRTHDPAYFATGATVSGSDITLTLQHTHNYEDGLIYGFTLTDNTGITNPRLRIQNDPYYSILLDNGTAATIEAEVGEIYFCVQYVENIGGTPYWRWLGHLQAYAVAEDNNPNSQFYTGSSIGEIRLPLFGGDYDNCVTDDLAQQRANYELYMHTNILDNVTITCVPIPWLEANTLVQYTLRRNNETRLYLIKSFNYGFNITDTMTITMMRYYPEYIG